MIPLTIQKVLSLAEAQFQDAGRDQASSLSEWGLAHCLHMTRSQLLTQTHRELTDDEQAAWAHMLQGLLDGTPLQYLTGETQFMDLTLACDERALIPRPETEQLVEWVLNDSRLWSHSSPRLTDVGTGSGCIALALAHYRPQAQITATDLSADALALARKNAELLGLTDRISFVHCSLLEGLKGGRQHAIVSNPPYIPETDWEALTASVRDREPQLALTSGQDGLDCMRQLVLLARDHLVPGGCLYMEIGEEQKDAISIMLTELNYSDIEFRRDLAGRTRMVKAEVAS